MIPIRDENPTTRPAIVTFLLIAGSVGAFAWMYQFDTGTQEWLTYTLGMVPAIITGAVAFEPYFAGFPPEASALTALFLHEDLIHLGGNMLFLWVFGNNIEDRLGHGRFLVFYLLAGLAASGAHLATEPTSPLPMIGASGAISGVLGAYLLLFPLARIRTLIPPFIFRTFPLPAWIFLGLWFAYNSVYAAGQMTTTAGVTAGGVAWTAHVAGFVAGMVLLLVLRPKGVRLFQRPARQVQGTTHARKPARGATPITAPDKPSGTAPAKRAAPFAAIRTPTATIAGGLPPTRRIVSR